MRGRKARTSSLHLLCGRPVLETARRRLASEDQIDRGGEVGDGRGTRHPGARSASGRRRVSAPAAMING